MRRRHDWVVFVESALNAKADALTTGLEASAPRLPRSSLCKLPQGISGGHLGDNAGPYVLRRGPLMSMSGVLAATSRLGFLLSAAMTH